MQKSIRSIAALLILALVLGFLPGYSAAYTPDIADITRLIPENLDWDTLKPIDQVLPSRQSQQIQQIQHTVPTQSLPQSSPEAQPAAVTASGKCGDNLTWVLEANTLTISGTGKMYDYSPENPAPWNQDTFRIFFIYIEEGVTSIGSYAFAGISRTIECIIPTSVCSVGSHAFYNYQSGYIAFLGDAPAIASDAFLSFPKTIYYFRPWDPSVLQSYGGTHVWQKGEIFLSRKTLLFPLNHTFTAEDFSFFASISEIKSFRYTPKEVIIDSYDSSSYGQLDLKLTVDGISMDYTCFITDGTNHLALIEITMDQMYYFKSSYTCPKPQIRIGTMELKESEDYHLIYENNFDPGADGMVIIQGRNFLEGYEKRIPFAILKTDLGDHSVKASEVPFEGSPMEPEASVYVDDSWLWDGYSSIQYSNNVNIGDATVRGIGKIGYYGCATSTFPISYCETTATLPGSYIGQADGELTDNFAYAEGLLSPGIFICSVDTDRPHIANYALYSINGNTPELLDEYLSPYGRWQDTYYAYDFSYVYDLQTEAGGAAFMLVYSWVTDSNQVYAGACVLLIPTKVPTATMAALEQADEDDFRREYLNMYGVDGDVGIPTWRSSDPSVATVADGVVTLKKPGKVTITAQYAHLEISKQLTVMPLSLDSAVIFLYEPDSGEIYVIFEGQILQNGTDYTAALSHSDGKTTITVTGTGLFTGQLIREFDSKTAEPLTHTHSFSHPCDDNCSLCDFTRPAAHQFSAGWTKNSDGHWHECTICGTQTDYAPHTFVNNSNQCSICGVLHTPGDLDRNFTVNEDDAIYLLQHILLPEFFPVDQAVDYNGDNRINEDDAIYLLQHVLLPEFFPL